jgi:hypothetical protein
MRLGPAAALVLAASFLAACGGGGGGDRLSKQEFQQRANATCTTYEKKVNELGNPQSPSQIPQYVEKGIPLIQQGVAELRRLHPPADLQEDYDRMLAEIEKSIPAARKLADAAAKKDAAAVQAALAEGRTASDAADEIAKKLGLTGCVSE